MRAASEREDLGGLRAPSRAGRDAAALDTPAKAEMAARASGVELIVTGAESREETGLSARVRKGGKMPPGLAEAVRHHRVGLVARLLAREPILGDMPEALAARLRKGRDGATLGELWPEACLLSQARFGHRCARLYPLLNGGVLVREGEDGRATVGTLLQAIAGRAMVFVPTDPPVHPFGDAEKPAFVPARTVQAVDVWPPAPGTAAGHRSRRVRPHDGEEANLQVLPALAPVREERP